MIVKYMQQLFKGKLTQPFAVKPALIAYYSEAGPDYHAWSKNFNMHFGYYQRGMSLLDREAMLENMNKQVLNRLALSAYKNNRVLDMGCGLGATARYAIKYYPVTELKAVTIVPWQLQQARILTAAEPLGAYVQFEDVDYECMPYSDDSFDGLYAIESACYARGLNKKQLIKEAYRVLKPGKRLVLSDGFIRQRSAMGFITRYCYRRMCNGWALDDFADFDAFTVAMQEQGFRNIKIEECYWQLAPSALHVPWVAIKYFFTHILNRQGLLNKQRWNHLLAPLFSLWLAASRKHFTYCLITAEKAYTNNNDISEVSNAH